MASVAPGVVVPRPRRPLMLEAVVEVEVKKPVVIWPIEDEERNESTNRAMFAKSVVEVAWVANKFPEISAFP